MRTIALLAIAAALIVMAGVQVYESPELVCARHRDRALEQYAPEPMSRSRYRVHLVEHIQQAEVDGIASKRLENMKSELENFDIAYQQYLQNVATIRGLAESSIAKKYVRCRGDWTLKSPPGGKGGKG